MASGRWAEPQQPPLAGSESKDARGYPRVHLLAHLLVAERGTIVCAGDAGSFLDLAEGSPKEKRFGVRGLPVVAGRPPPRSRGGSAHPSVCPEPSGPSWPGWEYRPCSPHPSRPLRLETLRGRGPNAQQNRAGSGAPSCGSGPVPGLPRLIRESPGSPRPAERSPLRADHDSRREARRGPPPAPGARGNERPSGAGARGGASPAERIRFRGCRMRPDLSPGSSAGSAGPPPARSLRARRRRRALQGAGKGPLAGRRRRCSARYHCLPPPARDPEAEPYRATREARRASARVQSVSARLAAAFSGWRPLPDSEAPPAEPWQIHMGERPYPCQECPHSFKKCIALKLHMWLHTGEKPFSCTRCGERFWLCKAPLSHQWARNAPTELICTECGNSFPCLRSLAARRQRADPSMPKGAPRGSQPGREAACTAQPRERVVSTQAPCPAE
ncbi:zinc finger protein GLI4-like [Candoia aspera]|uniref:zinc finger protein GLI4-like n=1 Tax=Candoia aspera TaxID=51853 RepID=UPI002FD7F33E